MKLIIGMLLGVSVIRFEKGYYITYSNMYFSVSIILLLQSLYSNGLKVYTIIKQTFMNAEIVKKGVLIKPKRPVSMSEKLGKGIISIE